MFSGTMNPAFRQIGNAVPPLLAKAVGAMIHQALCGGELKVIAAILEAPVIERILNPLGPQAWALPRALERGRMHGQSLLQGANHKCFPQQNLHSVPASRPTRLSVQPGDLELPALGRQAG